MTGTPGAGDLGPGTVTVRVEDATLPTNFDERTYDFTVRGVVYSMDFEAGCPPAGWSLGGDWECGAPSVVGPSTAHGGSNCIGTQIDANYNNSQAWDTAVADTPSIPLGASGSPMATFYMWVDTECCVYDGANLKISTNGGASFQIVNTVTPAYNLTVNSQSAWGDHQSASGWQEVTADLSAYTGQTIILRFAFRTDTSVVYPGVYIDDLYVLE